MYSDKAEPENGLACFYFTIFVLTIFFGENLQSKINICKPEFLLHRNPDFEFSLFPDISLSLLYPKLTAMAQESLQIHRIIQILIENPRRSSELAKLMETSDRTIRRYIPKIEVLGYLLEKDHHGRYFIFGGEEFRNRHFSPEERRYISNTLQLVHDKNPTRRAILEKLNAPELPIPDPESIKKHITAKNLEGLQWAIKYNVTVILKNYHSPKGEKLYSDRKVNPIALTEDCSQVIAYELSTRKEKTFNVDRIESIIPTGKNFETPKSKARYTDPFGFTNTTKFLVKLRLSEQARQLMIDDHPNTRQYISQEDGTWLFVGSVCDYRGIGRFILGLPGEIEIIESPELKNYLIERVKMHNF